YLIRRDHFMLMGNRRVNMMAVDNGYVSLFGNERGPTWMNRFDESTQQLGGGFSYIHLLNSTTPDLDSVYCTAFQFAPSSIQNQINTTYNYSRIFGVSYFETTMT